MGERDEMKCVKSQGGSVNSLGRVGHGIGVIIFLF